MKGGRAGLQPRSWIPAAWTALVTGLILAAARAARAEEEAAAPAPEPKALALIPRLPPPAWLASPSLLDPNAKHGRSANPLRLSLDLSASYLRLATTGDYKPGLAPFLGTSTEALGGFRLRF
jgi:hypothetical protein